jgi:hypothetical protein
MVQEGSHSANWEGFTSRSSGEPSGSARPSQAGIWREIQPILFSQSLKFLLWKERWWNQGSPAIWHLPLFTAKSSWALTFSLFLLFCPTGGGSTERSAQNIRESTLVVRSITAPFMFYSNALVFWMSAIFSFNAAVFLLVSNVWRSMTD